MKSQAQKHCSRLRWQCTAAFQRRGKLGWVTVTAMAWLDHTGIARAGCSVEECLVHSPDVLGLLPFLKANAFAERSRCLYYLLTLHKYTEKGGKTSAQTGGGKEAGAQPSLLPWQSQSAVTAACSPVQSKGPHGQSSAFSLSLGDAW